MPPCRMIYLHLGDIVDAMAHRCGPLAPIPVFSDRQSGKGAYRRQYRASHHKITRAGKSFAGNVAVHPVGIDAFIGFKYGQFSRIVIGNAHITAKNLCGGIGQGRLCLRQPSWGARRLLWRPARPARTCRLARMT